MDEASLREQKKQLRRAVTAKVKAMSAAARAEASKSISEQVFADPEYRRAERIFLFVSMPTEPDTIPIIRRALADGKQVYVPKCIGKTEMLAVHIADMTDFRPGAYGIPEPQDCSDTIGADGLDLILVPCVSAWSDGRRLGHGAGYYDRFLQGNAEKTICLCFSEAMDPEIPTDGNDVRMRRVITDAEPDRQTPDKNCENT